MPFSRITFFVLCGVFLVLSLISFSKVARAYEEDYWWTHKDMKLPYLQAAQGRFEIYINNQPLEKSIAQKLITAGQNGGLKPLRIKDITVRLNTADQMTLPDMIAGVSFGTAGLVFFLLYLVSFISGRPCRQIKFHAQ